MGILNNTAQNAANPDENEIPYFVESSTYECDLYRVSQGDSSRGALKVYTLSWVLSDKAIEALENKASNPLEYPTFEISFDANVDAQRAQLFATIGVPYNDTATKTVLWSPEGVAQWNGQLAEKCRCTGSAELKIETKAPNKRQGRPGYWPAKYEIKDIDPVGASEKAAQEGAAALVKVLKDPAQDKKPDQAAEALQGQADAAKPASRGGRRAGAR